MTCQGDCQVSMVRGTVTLTIKKNYAGHSHRPSDQASGTPKFFVIGADPTRIYTTRELPALKANPNVTLPPEIGGTK